VDAYTALDAVLDPELDEPITDLGFVKSLTVDGTRVTVHLRLPTSFCAPNFAYLMASDAKDVLTALPWTSEVVLRTPGTAGRSATRPTNTSRSCGGRSAARRTRRRWNAR
jgi:metal-sulfur cluster biosynthetic enzyme